MGFDWFWFSWANGPGIGILNEKICQGQLEKGNGKKTDP